MATPLFSGAYINEKEQKSYPIGTASPGYDANGKVIPAQSSFMNSNPASAIVPTAPVTRSKYIDPKTGQYFKTAADYGNYVATKIPVSGDIPKYAGDAMTNPDQSATDLQATARDLNNTRNDIATGTTDPYNVGNKSGIAYSPTELKAIEKAYAGIYDPALNDVFARLKDKQTADAAKAKREDEIFQTNESIRQWKATTGSKGGGNSDLFTQTQLNNGARNAGMTIDGFSKLDEDLQNYFIQPPTAKDDITGQTKTIDSFFKEDIAAVKKGDKKTADVAADIAASTLPESVKHYYIDQLPLTDVVKESWFSKIWNRAVTGQPLVQL
jgi:hypothetical protein